jgi:hypothetical protein
MTLVRVLYLISKAGVVTAVRRMLFGKGVFCAASFAQVNSITADNFSCIMISFAL